jgi:hypothetical protein
MIELTVYLPGLKAPENGNLILNFLQRQPIIRGVGDLLGLSTRKSIFKADETLKKSKRDLSESNRRQWPRLKPEAVPFLKSVSFSQGDEARIINISRGGILLETDVRLRPQMKLILKLITTEGIIKMEGQILRSSITSLKGIPRYCSAIAFAHPFHMLDDLSEEVSEPAGEIQELSSELTDPATTNTGTTQPSMQSDPGCQPDENSSILTFVAQDGISLQDMFEMNDW